jgi:hypothetical protein
MTGVPSPPTVIITGSHEYKYNTHNTDSDVHGAAVLGSGSDAIPELRQDGDDARGWA